MFDLLYEYYMAWCKNCETLEYAVFSNRLLFSHSYVQIFSTETSSQSKELVSEVYVLVTAIKN
jgi:hypothetical protein